MEGDYQSDFQNFMMGATPKNSQSTPKASATPTTTITTPTKSPQKRKPERQYSTIIKAFQGTLQRDWLDVDDNLAAVMRSISNLRDRIYWSSQQLRNKSKREDWQTNSCGPRVYLLKEDIELALAYEMQQHELMMAGARSLLSSMNQAQEALGRRLAEGMQYEIDLQGECYARGELPPPSVMGTLEDVYGTLAEELYHKQMAVQDVLDCTNDFLLANDEDLITADENPRKVAKRSCEKWNLMSQNPEVQEVMSFYCTN